MDRQPMSVISRFTAKTVTAIMAVILLASPLSVYADGDAYFIDQGQILAWRYWMNHITNNQQYVNVEGETLELSQVQSYSFTTYARDYVGDNNYQAAVNLANHLNDIGCNASASQTSKVTAVCPVLSSAQIEELNSKFNFFYRIPWMSGTITQPTSYSTADRIYLSSNVEYIFAFYINSNVSGYDLKIHYSDGTVQTAQYKSSGGITSNGLIMTYKFTNTGDARWGTLSIPQLNGVSSALVSPIYLGRTANCTTDIREILNIDSKEIEAINSGVDNIVNDLVIIAGKLETTNTRLNTINTSLGTVNSSIGTMNTNLGGKLNSIYDRQNTVMNSINSNIDSMESTLHSDNNLTNSRLSTIIERINTGNTQSTQAVNKNNQTTSEIVNSSGSFMEKEDSAIDDMETGLGSINTGSSDLLRSSKFIASANWVTTQFTRLVTNTPFELLIYFSLVLGLALVFIRKVE